MADSPVVLPQLVWRPSPNYRVRASGLGRLIVVHETAGSYDGAVSWLRNPASKASAHLVLREDGKECSQLVRLRDTAWTQAAYNVVSYSIELANMTAKGYHSDYQLRVAARIVGWLCMAEVIPARWARGGYGHGVCMHSELGEAGGGHTRCGPDAIGWQRFLTYLRHEIERGGYKKEWARL